MKKRYNNLLIVCIIMSLSFQFSIAEESVKEITKSFTADDQTLLSIDSRYGKITYSSWEGDSVVVKITIIAEGNNKSNLDDKVEKIKIHSEISGNTISLKTDIDEEILSSKWINWDDKYKNLQINYYVQMPDYISLKLQHKYGQVELDNHFGYVNFDLKYCDGIIKGLNEGKRENINEFTVGYCDIEFGQIGWIKLNSKYSDIIVNNSQTIIALTKYSDVKIDNVTSLLVESKYDDYKIHSLKNLVTEAAYTDFKIDQVISKVDIDSKYTDLKAGWVDPDFVSIRIDSQYGTMRFGIDNTAGYKLEGTAKYCNINYPEPSNVSRLQETTTLLVGGIVGNYSSPVSTVKINTKYGNISLLN